MTQQQGRMKAIYKELKKIIIFLFLAGILFEGISTAHRAYQDSSKTKQISFLRKELAEKSQRIQGLSSELDAQRVKLTQRNDKLIDELDQAREQLRQAKSALSPEVQRKLKKLDEQERVIARLTREAEKAKVLASEVITLQQENVGLKVQLSEAQEQARAGKIATGVMTSLRTRVQSLLRKNVELENLAEVMQAMKYYDVLDGTSMTRVGVIACGLKARTYSLELTNLLTRKKTTLSYKGGGGHRYTQAKVVSIQAGLYEVRYPGTDLRFMYCLMEGDISTVLYHNGKQIKTIETDFRPIVVTPSDGTWSATVSHPLIKKPSSKKHF